MAQADTCRLSIIWKLDGADHAVNVLHFDSNGHVIDQADADAVAAAVDAAFISSNFEDTVANNYSLDRIVLRDLNVDNQPEFSAIIDSPGLVAADVLPLSTSLCITLRTPLAGRDLAVIGRLPPALGDMGPNESRNLRSDSRQHGATFNHGVERKNSQGKRTSCDSRCGLRRR